MIRMTTGTRLIAVSIALLCAMALAVAQESGTWKAMRLPPISDVWDLNAIAFVSPTRGWAAGSIEKSGCAVVMEYTGSHWEKVYSPCSGKHWVVHLLDISLSGPDDGWIVGDKYYIWSDPDRFKGMAVKISDGRCREFGLPNVARSFKLEAVSIERGSHIAWAVGGTAQRKYRSGLVMRYDGRWREATPPPPADYQWELKDIDCPAPGRCWAVGHLIHPRWAEAGEKPPERPKNVNSLVVMAYRDGKWSRELTPEAPPEIVNQELSCVQFPTPTEGWVGGRGVMLHYSNGTWEMDAPLDRVSGWDIKSISFSDPDNGHAVGWDIDTKTPLWLERTDGGWRRTKSPYDKKLMSLRDVDFLRPDLGWAVGGVQVGENYPAAVFRYGP